MEKCFRLEGACFQGDPAVASVDRKLSIPAGA